MKKEVSCRKVTSLYQLGYLIDKKGHRKRKNIGRKNCCFKKYAYFCTVKMANKTNVFIRHFTFFYNIPSPSFIIDIQLCTCRFKLRNG